MRPFQMQALHHRFTGHSRKYLSLMHFQTPSDNVGLSHSNPMSLFSAGVTLMTMSLYSGAAAGQAPESAEEEGRPDIEEIIIVDTRLDDDAFGIGEGIAIDREDLSRIQPVDPEQLFQRLPGFSVSRPGGSGGVSEIFLRGAESNFTAVYIDGIRLNNSANTRGGSFDFSMVDIHGIERVDVATGAMSAVYGADAMAGVIRIRSAWAEPGTSTVFGEVGSAGDWRAGLGTSFRTGDASEWNLRASTTEGGSEIEGSSLRMDSFGSRLVGEWADRGSWEVSLRHVQRDRTSFPEVSGGPEHAVLRDLEVASGDELSMAAAGNLQLSDGWTSDLYISGARIRDDNFVPAVAPGVLDGQPAFSAITEYQRAQILWVNRFELSQDLSLVAGVDSIHEDGSDEGFIDFGSPLPNAYDLDRTLNSAFAELGRQWSNGLTATLAARWDHSGDEKRLSGKFSVEKTVSDNGNRIWAQVANGFKLPSFFALGNPLYGNPDLVVEKVQYATLGYTHLLPGEGELVVSVYQSRYDDLVDFDFENFTNVNRGQYDVSGLEIRTILNLTQTLQLRLDGNWSEISSSAAPLRRRPERTGGASLDWMPTRQWQLNVAARYTGPRLMTSIPTGDISDPGYTIVSATANYQPAANRRFWIAVDNAFDEDYQDAPGFPSPGARLRVGSRLTF